TGYIHLLDDAIRREVLQQTRQTLGGGGFLAGAFVSDQPGDAFDAAMYRARIDEIQQAGGTPVVFQSFGLVAQESADIVASYATLGEHCDRFFAFELTRALAPFGRIYDLETYAGLLRVPQCVGAKHSSFHREPEWQRLVLRDRLRPEFIVLTGNDFAIDMVMYGSDYLLGLSTFAPGLFARRDAFWKAGDPAFYELNDQLQYLGFLTFREPGPAYKHSAAQFLHLCGKIASNRTYPGSPERPESDLPILRELAVRLGLVKAESPLG
ncbi:MAG: dihydrodipicolinate synthase family protein, partial [Planctomycetaceae bacterium]|nr:dihydrodipicolinate synthase family protein [Planctomycetaceae bacterium]